MGIEMVQFRIDRLAQGLYGLTMPAGTQISNNDGCSAPGPLFAAVPVLSELLRGFFLAAFPTGMKINLIRYFNIQQGEAYVPIPSCSRWFPCVLSLKACF